MISRVRREWMCALSVCVVIVVVGSSASALTFQPNELRSQDVFTYQFDGAGFGISPSAAQQNLDTVSLQAQAASPVIGLLLGTSRSETTTHRIDPATGALVTAPDGQDIDTGHDGFSWLRFDLSGLAHLADGVQSARLNLYALDGFGITGAFANPSVAEPVVTELYAADGLWDEQSLTWANQGAFEPAVGSPVDSVTQTGVGQWISFDVTSLVQNWMANPGVNTGFFLRQRDIVPSLVGTGGQTGVVSSLYASSWFGSPTAPAFNTRADAAFRPFLQIDVPTPEPVTATLAFMSLGALGMATRRRMV